MWLLMSSFQPFSFTCRVGAAAAAAAAGCCSCWCYRWCYTGVFRARCFVASVPLDMTIWKEVQVLRSFFPCCKSSVPCCSMMQSHLNYDEICTSFEVGVTCVPLCLYFPIFL